MIWTPTCTQLQLKESSGEGDQPQKYLNYTENELRVIREQGEKMGNVTNVIVLPYEKQGN